jgi:uncharacterized protein YebE (UPF0316 family)
LAALIIFTLRVFGVAIGTLRTLLMARGVLGWSAALGFFEVLVYVLAIGVVVQDLTNVVNLVAYCGGFSAGTILGIQAESRMALGFVTLRTFSAESSRAVAQALRDGGFGATLNWGEGLRGPVGVVSTVVPRRRARTAHDIILGVDPDAFIIADDTLTVARGWMPMPFGGSTVRVEAQPSFEDGAPAPEGEGVLEPQPAG